MKRIPWVGSSTRSPSDVDLFEDPETVRIPLVDEVFAIPSPDIDHWSTKAHDHGAVEQRHLWTAEGEARAREAEATARRLTPAAEAQQDIINGARDLARAAKEQLAKARNILRPHIVRPRFDDIRYHLALLILFGGDVAGGTGAAIALGEVVWLAVLQMLAVGAAGICIGGLASEAKYARTGRTRAKAGVPKGAEELGLGYLFLSPDPGEVVVRKVLMAGCMGVALIAVGIGTLRWSTDGHAAGLVFGCLAAAVVFGSGANSYVHADVVSDVLDGFDRDHRKAVRELLRAGRLSDVARRAESESLGASHRRETDERGAAAAEHVTWHGLEVLSNNPAVAGNGPAGARVWPKPSGPNVVGNGEVEGQTNGQVATYGRGEPS